MPERQGPTGIAKHLGGDLDTALDSLRLPAWILDRRGDIRWENGRAIEVFGEVVGHPWTEVVPPDAVRQVQAELAKKLLGTVRSTDYTTVVRTRSGERLKVEIHSVAIGDRHVVGVFGVADELGDLPATAPLAELTPRQHEVLAALLRGASTDDIADSLQISRETVRNHIRGIFRALRVRSRVEAILEARRRGMSE